MVKLTYEHGHLVLRSMGGALIWSAHVLDVKGSLDSKSDSGGFKEIIIQGKLTEINNVTAVKTKIKL